MTKGRKEMQAQEDSLIRAQRIVESTIEVGAKTAETLHQQGQQMERVLDALEEIKFSLKKANQVIRDITRSIATDKCGPFSLPPCSHRHARSRHIYGIFRHLLLHMSCCTGNPIAPQLSGCVANSMPALSFCQSWQTCILAQPWEVAGGVLNCL